MNLGKRGVKQDGAGLLEERRQTELVKQIQRELALLMAGLLLPGFAVGFTLNWPWLKNYGIYTPGGLPNFSSSRVFTEYWYDAIAKT